MICRADYDAAAGQGVHVQQQRTDHPLDFARFMGVASLLADAVEFVEKQDAWHPGGVVDNLLKPGRGFAEKAPD